MVGMFGVQPTNIGICSKRYKLTSNPARMASKINYCEIKKMLRQLQYTLTLIAIFGLQACTAPLSNDYTARSFGKNNFGFDGGAASTGDYVQGYLRGGYGLTENTDVGLVGEVGQEALLGVWGKYSFINNPDDYSFAMSAGTGYTAPTGNLKNGGAYIWTGPIVSYKYNWWEPYLSARINYTTFGELYGQVTLGNNIWFSPKFGLTVAASGILGTIRAAYVSAGLILRL